MGGDWVLREKVLDGCGRLLLLAMTSAGLAAGLYVPPVPPVPPRTQSTNQAFVGLAAHRLGAALTLNLVPSG